MIEIVMSSSRPQDLASAARSISQAAERPDDLVDAFLERSEEVVLHSPERANGFRVCREKGLAVRLARDGRTWTASRDRIDGEALADALRQVVRVRPQAAYSPPSLDSEDWADRPEASEVLRFPGELERQILGRHVAFPYHLRVGRKRRHVQVVGSRLIPEPQSEAFYAVEVECPWARYGMLLPELGPAAADRLARSLVALFEAREAAAVTSHRGVVVLGPAATAVFLHEAVAHALEIDVVTRRAVVEETIGSAIAASCLDVLDDPAGAPAPVARTSDDEGVPVIRRWLLRGGIVENLLSDRSWALHSEQIEPGAGRRADRHAAIGPRSYHLELLPGESSREDLLAEAAGGLFFADAESGRFDPRSGRVELSFRAGRRIGRGGLEGPVGPWRWSAKLEDLLGAVTAVGRERSSGGAGWCAKDGQRLPVWATSAAIRIEGWT